ncbi:hypothetical protein [Stigmatella aurantiaca]|uniref:Conserved uncharacterized protein n=1 Tax=Stigmatella aurantiaca (strain DW4/3-1) TaxID=378806 RepID=Q09AE8_STIAD|nr:hypothetical protein [Stigmatella aurantiaca]ADO67993.1 conserved uncharacterized protein [Stigmatella aurantiaca DW4/3-1]EAU68766.1 hypothetical protein STIAU_2820 [Stigmatella aurantiaca DW4/3-1]
MASSDALSEADLQRMARAEAPDLIESVIAFLAQPEPPPSTPLPQGSLDFQGLKHLLAQAQSRHDAEARSAGSREAWQRFLAQQDVPLPARFALADLLVGLYTRNTDASRAVLLELARTADLRFGLWGGLKRIYKLAEQRHDAELFGVLAWRFDVERHTSRSREVSLGTLTYLRRRAWRYLRQLGAAVPELFPQFAAEVLRHYAPDTHWQGTWVSMHLWAHGTGKYNAQGFSIGLPSDLVKHRAFPDAWKRSPDALMRLLDTCLSDPPARFAIQGLRQDFPEVLRGQVTPAWLDRLARRPLGSAHEFLVETLQGSPEYHQGKLRALGLHEAVLALLESPSAKARAYAIEYARAHAQDLSAERLETLIAHAPPDTVAFAVAVLEKRAPRELGVDLLGRLLGYGATNTFAARTLEQAFDRAELSHRFLIDLFLGGPEPFKWVKGYVGSRYAARELPASLYKDLLTDPRLARMRSSASAPVEQFALKALGTYSPEAIGPAWLLEHAIHPRLGPSVTKWLTRAEALPGLDVEQVKGMVFHGRSREVALALLGNRKLFSPRQLTVPWLLALARRADPALHAFAHRYLLESVEPGDFSESGDAAAGLERLFELALGPKQPAPVRQFAQTYLRCHHPVIGPEQPESTSYGLKPRAPRKAYTAARLWPAFFDTRDDVRRFALALARVELRAWGALPRVYELAEADAKEVRALAYDALLNAGEAGADERATLTPEELDPVKVFTLTESTRQSTREVAMELIRRHYARLGGAERLAWLMESADREVGLFAARLLWEKHRPAHLPEGWKPAGAAQASPAPTPERFAHVEALRNFLRRMLFGLPPGRSKEGREGLVARRLSASTAKRRVIELMRDLGLEDAAFARLVAPVLSEFTGSLAKGEWQSCLASLVRLRAAHPSLSL